MLVFQQLISKKAKLPRPIKQKAIQFIPVVSNIGFNLKANTCDLKGSSPAIKMTLLYLLYLFSILYVRNKGFFSGQAQSVVLSSHQQAATLTFVV